MLPRDAEVEPAGHHHARRVAEGFTRHDLVEALVGLPSEPAVDAVMGLGHVVKIDAVEARLIRVHREVDERVDVGEPLGHPGALDRSPRRRLAHTDILARSLPQVRCPVHAIYGASDALYKRWISALEGAFRATGAPFVGMALVPGCGHWVQYEQPGAFHVALREALR